MILSTIIWRRSTGGLLIVGVGPSPKMECTAHNAMISPLAAFCAAFSLMTACHACAAVSAPANRESASQNTLWEAKRLHDALIALAYGLGDFSNLVCAAVTEIDVAPDGCRLRGVECLTTNQFEPYHSLERHLASGDSIPCIVGELAGGYMGVRLSWVMTGVRSGTERCQALLLLQRDVRQGRYILGFRERRPFELNAGSMWNPTWRQIKNEKITVYNGENIRETSDVAIDDVKAVIRKTLKPLTEDPILSTEEWEKAKQLRGVHDVVLPNEIMKDNEAQPHGRVERPSTDVPGRRSP